MTAERQCGPCQACCHVFHIEELPEAAPRWVDCQHQCASGCAIYLDRPHPCVQFRCAWIEGWGELEDRPDLFGAMLELLPARPRIDVPARAVFTEVREGGADTDRFREHVSRLHEDARKVVLVPYRAKGFENFGRELPRAEPS